MLILVGQPDALKRLMDEAKLKLVRDENTGEIDAPDDDIGVMEAIVTAEFAAGRPLGHAIPAATSIIR